MHPDNPSGNSKTLSSLLSAQGHAQAVAKRIVELAGMTYIRIEAADPYAKIDTATGIQNEAYNDLRPERSRTPIRKLSAI